MGTNESARPDSCTSSSRPDRPTDNGQGKCSRFFTASSDQKAVIDGICWWSGGGERRSMQTVPVKEWEKSAVDCLDIVADASK